MAVYKGIGTGAAARGHGFLQPHGGVDGRRQRLRQLEVLALRADGLHDRSRHGSVLGGQVGEREGRLVAHLSG